MFKLRYLLIGFILGLIVAWLWLTDETPNQPARPSASPMPRPAAAKAKDPLTEIDGIGPTYERALNALGILTFAQLAAQSPDALAANLAARVTAERIRREKWIEQAKQRAK